MVMTDSNQELFRADDCVAFDIGQGQAFVYSRTMDTVIVCPREVALLLRVCKDWRSLEAHLNALVNHPIVARTVAASATLSGDDPAQPQFSEQQLRQSIRQHLENAIGAGLLVSDSDIRNRLSGGRVTSETPNITSIGFVTRNRAACLARCASSYIENIGSAIEHTRILVMDDSDSTEHRSATRCLMKELKNRYGCRIGYADFDAKQRFVHRLHDVSQVPIDVIRFALTDVENYGCSIGANRNCLLLQTVGELGLSADDDTVCQMYLGPSSELLRYSSSQDIAQQEYFPDRESGLATLTPVDTNILSLHEQLLGRTLMTEALTLENSNNFELHRMSRKLLRAVTERAGKIALTFMGRVGDVANPYNMLAMFADGDQRQAIMQSHASYLTNCTSREALRNVPSPVVCDQELARMPMSTVMGFDNRVLLPPFLPVLRGEDAIFGLILNRCFTEAHYGYLPEIVLHAPMESRTNRPEDLWNAMVQFPYRRFVEIFLQTLSLPQCGPHRSLALVGEHLMAVGSQSMPSFVEHLKLGIWQFASSRLTVMEQLLDKYQGKPDFWAIDARKHNQLLLEAMLEDDFYVPADIKPGRTREDALELTRKLTFKFGELLHWWPQLVEASRELKSQHKELAIEL